MLDGYTIMISTGSWATSAAMYKPAFDPVNNIAPIAGVGYNPLVLAVHPSLAVLTTRELNALVRSNLGQHAYAMPDVGSITHLSSELMLNVARSRKPIAGPNNRVCLAIKRLSYSGLARVSRCRIPWQ